MVDLTEFDWLESFLREISQYKRLCNPTVYNLIYKLHTLTHSSRMAKFNLRDATKGQVVAADTADTQAEAKDGSITFTIGPFTIEISW